jgi:KUP system potassium uptake protein
MHDNENRQGLGLLTLGALGVVYGDIGTSPLYTMKEVFHPANGVPLDAPDIIGAVSVIFWALMVVVTLKYVILILRADNRGEGGIMALTALAAGGTPTRRTLLLLTGVLGTALFYGDSVITPAISVLGAVEGLEAITPNLKPYVLPISIAIIVALFTAQRFGTEAVGKLFGPIISVWFIVLAFVGVLQIVQHPGILAALNPLEAVAFLHARGWHLFVVMGSIVLALTGAEALYADMGHFGARPIRIAWTGLVLPSLALNYVGQGALLMRDPSALESPFYRLFPQAWLIPAVLLATAASVIASQAVISGAYSMTKQAIQLGLHAAHARAEHLGERGGADLRPHGELGRDGGRSSRHRRFRQLVGAGLRLWHRRHGDDVHHDAADLLRRSLRLAVFAGGRRCRDVCLPGGRRSAGDLVFAEGPAGRLVPAGDGSGDLRRDGDMEARP